MYNGEMRVEESELTDLLATAESLQVKGLCNVRDKNDEGGNRSEELKDQEKSESDNNILENELTKLSPVDADYKVGSNDGHEQGEENRPKKRRKMSHTVNKLAYETTFTSHQTIFQNPENIHKPPESIPTEPFTIKVPKLPNQEIEKSKFKTRAKTKERPTVICGKNGPEKIRRPPNAFMIFANEWRRRLATEHPRESNTEISARLGTMWEGLTVETKDCYYALAKKVDEEHKRKYPGYFYSPKEARIRKSLKNDSMLDRCLPPTAKEVTDSDFVQFTQVYINGSDGYPQSPRSNGINNLIQNIERTTSLKDISRSS